jgi:hypothetical protein
LNIYLQFKKALFISIDKDPKLRKYKLSQIFPIQYLVDQNAPEHGTCKLRNGCKTFDRKFRKSIRR